jgi:hypothetical protein
VQGDPSSYRSLAIAVLKKLAPARTSVESNFNWRVESKDSSDESCINGQLVKNNLQCVYQILGMASAVCQFAALTSGISDASQFAWQHTLKTRIANLKNWLLN